MNAPTCLDCGQPIPPTLDGVPLCDECIKLAAAFGHTPEERVEMLSRGLEVTA